MVMLDYGVTSACVSGVRHNHAGHCLAGHCMYGLIAHPADAHTMTHACMHACALVACTAAMQDPCGRACGESMQAQAMMLHPCKHAHKASAHRMQACKASMQTVDIRAPAPTFMMALLFASW